VVFPGVKKVAEFQKKMGRVWPLFAGECALINEAPV